MKKRIIEKIEELDGNASFVDLQDLPGFSGDQHLGRSEYNYVYWINVSDAFIRAIHELVSDGVVEIEVTSVMTYVIDGCTLSFPLVEDAVPYDSPRWLPVILNKGVNFYNVYKDLAA